jgi:amino acid adenylation domain-containing protein
MSQHGPRDVLHEHFARQVARRPHQIALLEGERSITYQELDDRSDRIAAGLAANGIRHGSMVGLHMERSIEWVACALAILKANAAVVPLPPSYPPGRLADIVQHAVFDGVIDGGGGAVEHSFSGRRLPLEWIESQEWTPAVPHDGQPDSPAFVLSSSGSTGRPKMIVRSHRSFFHRLGWTWREHPYEPGEVCCQKSYMTTTHAVYELFEPLLRGVPLVIISDKQVRDLELFWQILRVRKVSRLLLVPSQLQASLALPGFTAPGLRVLVLMGEYLSSLLAEQVLSVFPPSTRVFSIYGSTEASSTLVCDVRELFHPGRSSPWGFPSIQPCARSSWVLDLSWSAPGEIGRLHMGGPALFSGYLKDSELTASVLVRSPHLDTPLYDTGDEVRLTALGHLEYIGRADGMIKVRGFRVDVSEVERALLSSPGVRQAAVIGSQEGVGAERLFAFVSPGSVDTSELYAAARDRLPEYMIPSMILAVESLPLTPGGKVDRLKLLDDLAQRPSRVGLLEDQSETERGVSEGWIRVLGGFEQGMDVSFFEAGGTSLSVFSLVHELRQRFGAGAPRARRPGRIPFSHVAELGPLHRGGSSYRTVAIGCPARRPRYHANPGDPETWKGSCSPPLFLVASAGGALGSYRKLAQALRTPRKIIGVRDPYTWGERDPRKGFDHWVSRYVEAIRERQSSGPYYVGAYSSGGAFGYEIARRLRAQGEEVGLLALIDPLAIDRRTKWRFGWWALRCVWARYHIRLFTRIMGWLRFKPLSQTRLFPFLSGRDDGDPAVWESEEFLLQARRDRGHILTFSALLELNSGIPYTLAPSELDGIEADEYLEVLMRKVCSLTPEVDPVSVERILLQYPLQVRAQHAYRLKPYDGRVLLVEPATRYGGLLRLQFRPYVKHLETVVLRVGESKGRLAEVSEQFGVLRTHLRCMRDDVFVDGLARELDARLAGVVRREVPPSTASSSGEQMGDTEWTWDKGSTLPVEAHGPQSSAHSRSHPVEIASEESDHPIA